jgi:hypothetical protein
MLLVKTSFFFVFMPYICDPFSGSQKPEVGKKGIAGWHTILQKLQIQDRWK